MCLDLEIGRTLNLRIHPGMSSPGSTNALISSTVDPMRLRNGHPQNFSIAQLERAWVRVGVTQATLQHRCIIDAGNGRRRAATLLHSLGEPEAIKASMVKIISYYTSLQSVLKSFKN